VVSLPFYCNRQGIDREPLLNLLDIAVQSQGIVGKDTLRLWVRLSRLWWSWLLLFTVIVVIVVIIVLVVVVVAAAPKVSAVVKTVVCLQ
jgi:hypothetical protein